MLSPMSTRDGVQALWRRPRSGISVQHGRVTAALATTALVMATLFASGALDATLAAAQPPGVPTYPTYWSGAFTADPAGQLDRISCASSSLCVAVDDAGNVVWSTNPDDGEGVWKVTPVAGEERATSGGISCSTEPVCVAVGAGQMLVSGDPTGGSAAWRVEALDAGHTLTGVSCVTSSLCVAVDERGDLLSSTEPASGAASWKVADIDGEVPLTDISCASASLCVALDANGNVLVSTEPSGGSATWKSAHVGGDAQHISCISTPLCVATGSNEAISSSDPTGGAGAWQTASVPEVGGGIACGTPSLCVAFSGPTNAGITASADPAAGAPSWMTSEGVGARKLSALSCASSSLCVAAEGGLVLLGTATNELSALLVGSGRGRVQSSPIACPWSTCAHAPPGIVEPLPITSLVCEDIIFASPAPLCQFAFPPGEQISLTATPAAGDVFAGWSGDCTGLGACSLAMNTSHAVTATFALKTKAPPGVPAEPPHALRKPTIYSLRETHRAFLPASFSTAIVGRAAGHRSRGTTFSLRLDQSATVEIRIVAVTRGRVGRACKPEGRGHRTRCIRTRTIAVLARAGHEGANSIAFSGCLRGKALTAGDYEAMFTATNAAGKSASRRLDFRVL
jgi:hypothetical protein